MGGWSDGSDGAGMQRMPKVAHVQMMVMMMIGDVQTNEANYAKVAHVQSISRQDVKTCETFGERKKCPQKFSPGEYLMICDKCVVIVRICVTRAPLLYFLKS